MARNFRTLNKSDKLIAGVALLNVGVQSRIKMLRVGFRVCFTGDQTIVANVLNANGYRAAAGSLFTDRSFNGGRNEVFVRCAEV